MVDVLGRLRSSTGDFHTHVAKQRKVSELEVGGVDVTSLVRAQAEKRRAVRKPTAYTKHRLKSTVRYGRRHRTPSKG